MILIGLYPVVMLTFFVGGFIMGLVCTYFELDPEDVFYTLIVTALFTAGVCFFYILLKHRMYSADVILNSLDFIVRNNADIFRFYELRNNVIH